MLNKGAMSTIVFGKWPNVQERAMKQHCTDDAWERQEEPLKPFRLENIPAYLTVMVAWVAVAGILAGIANRMFHQKPTSLSLLVFALVCVMSGMAIMFTASLLNLAKMKAGLARLAAGDTNPRIPPVWCPVLTAATHAVTKCARHLATQKYESERSDMRPS